MNAALKFNLWLLQIFLDTRLDSNHGVRQEGAVDVVVVAVRRPWIQISRLAGTGPWSWLRKRTRPRVLGHCTVECRCIDYCGCYIPDSRLPSLVF